MFALTFCTVILDCLVTRGTTPKPTFLTTGNHLLSAPSTIDKMDANQYSGYLYHTSGSSSSQSQGNLNMSQGHLHLVDDDVDMIAFDDPEEIPFDELFVANNQSDLARMGNKSAIMGDPHNPFPSNQPNYDQFSAGSFGAQFNHVAAAPNRPTMRRSCAAGASRLLKPSRTLAMWLTRIARSVSLSPLHLTDNAASTRYTQNGTCL